MNLSEKIKNIDFLKNRTIIDCSERNNIGLIGFKDCEDDLYSSIIASPKSTSGVIPDTVMISTKGCLLRLDDGDKTIVISMSKEDSKDSFTVEFPSSIDSGEFFQSTLLHDYRHIGYEHIEALRKVLELMNDVYIEDN